MKVVFRTDASSWIGSGHTMRCATIAKHLKKKKVEIHFVCRKMPGDYTDWLIRQNFNVHILPESKSPYKTPNSGLAHESWLGVTSFQEQEDTRSVLSSIDSIEWLVIDHYGLDCSWETAMKSYSKKIMVIDDLADRKHVCDLLLDQNLFTNARERYQDKIPDTCEMLLGPQYALLQDEYALLHGETAFRKGDVKRILVFFGGADEKNNSEMAIQAFMELNREDIELDVVVGQCHQQFTKFKKTTKHIKNINIYSDLPTLAPLMAKADIALGASGATSWERCCMGLPSIVIALAENQIKIASELDSGGFIHYLGDVGIVTKNDIYSCLKQLVDLGIPSDWSERCWNLVDGNGVKRVSSFMGIIDEY